MAKTYLILKDSFIAHSEAVAKECFYFKRNKTGVFTTVTKLKHDMRFCDQCGRLEKKSKK